MKVIDYLIVGGGVAGTTAAEVLRTNDLKSSIHIVTAEPDNFYERKMLSKPEFYLGKVDEAAVYIKPEAWYREHRIDSTRGHGVVALDPTAKTVTLDDGQVLGYKKLLLAYGTNARRWEVPGNEKKGVMNLRTLADARRVIEEVKHAKQAVVIGGGFIGFEMCHLLQKANIATTLVLREAYFWQPLLDQASGQMIEAALARGGIRIIHQAVVDSVMGQEHVKEVRLSNGETLSADMVIAGIGTVCAIDWVTKAGIACNHGILANKYLETNIPDIWAAGDVAEYEDLVLNEHIQLGSWQNAHLHGQTVAMNMLGRRQPFHHVSFYKASALGIDLAFVGDVRLLPDRSVITRGSPAEGGYTRIIVMGNQVEGATMINRLSDLEPLAAIIEQDLPVAGHEKQFANPNFDLGALLK